MKSKSLLVLTTFISLCLQAQTLPDEINAVPYEVRYRSLVLDVNQTQGDLNQSNTSLAAARKFLVDEAVQIQNLENAVRGYENEVANLRKLIPNLEGQLINLQNQEAVLLQQIRGRENEGDNLANRRAQELRNLTPLQDLVEKKQQRARQLDASLQEMNRNIREAETRLGRAQTDFQQLSVQVEVERNQQRQLRVEFGTLDGQMNILINQIGRDEAQIQTEEGQLSQQRQQLQQLERTVEAARNQLAILRSQGPSATAIADLERRLNTSTSQRDRAAQQVSSLETIQRQAQSEVSRIQGTLPNLETQFNTEGLKLQALEKRVVEYSSELATLRSNGGTPEQIKDAERKLNAVSSTRDRTQSGLRDLEGQVLSAKSELARNQSTLANIGSQVAGARDQLINAEREVASDRRNLDILRNSGPSVAVIADAERRVANATADRDRLASLVNSDQARVAQLQNNLRTKRADLEILRRSQASLPTRIAQSENRERELINQRANRNQEIVRMQVDLGNLQRNAQGADSALATLANELKIDQVNLQRQISLLENLDRQIQTVDTERTSLINQHKQLAQSIANLTAQIAQSKSDIPKIQGQITANQNEISQGKQDMDRARGDERNLVQTIASLQERLGLLTRNRDAAQSEMSQRSNLYNKYLWEAQSLGDKQSGQALALGEKEGQRLAQVTAKSYGESMGKELGLGKAKYWGSVRGEFLGYDQGYAEGLQSTGDITRGQVEGEKNGKDDADLTAITTFRPQYFEEALILEFQKPVSARAAFHQLMKQMYFEVEESSMIREEISPVSPDEIKRSDELKTPLDSILISLKKDVKALTDKALSLEAPRLVYRVPTTIPYGEVKCTAVYKNLTVYRDACETSYKASFQYSFLASSEKIFSEAYTTFYKTQLNQTDIVTREAQFPLELKGASEVSSAFGLKLGKEDIYEQTFKTSYKESYDRQLPVAKDAARVDAQKDLTQLMDTKALLTLGKSSLSATDFRGSEEVFLLAQVKNISNVAHQGPVLLKVTEAQNVVFSAQEVVLNSASARSLTGFAPLKGQINSLAKTGDKIVVRGLVTLPGDLYKPQRQETFELVQVLSANPTHDLKLDYLKNPDIKNIFRRHVHTLTATIRPLAEEIPSGYQVNLASVGENSNLINLNGPEAATGSLKKGESKDVSFTYTFLNAAKAKTINLELSISFEGKVIKREKIALQPN